MSGRAILAAAMFCAALGAQRVVVAGDVEAGMLHAYLGRWEAQGVSAALLVARGDEILLSEGYGLARRAAEIPVTPDTIFDIGSLGKQFTATAILALVEDGRLDLRQPIGAVLSDLPEDKAAITLHHLLTHTSGIDDFECDEPIDRQEFFRRWAKQPSMAAPGASYSYSNVGYTLLAAIVEELTGERFEQYVKRRLFARADLTDTAFVWEAAFPWPRQRTALGYGGFADACGGEDPLAHDDSFLLRGSGSVLSTVTDLHRWGRALDRGVVLRPETRRLLFQSHTLAEADFLSYGYGWRIQRTPRGTGVVWHSGLEGAFNSVYRRYEDEGLTVVFLSNHSIDGVPMRDLLLRPAREGLIGNLLFGGTVAMPPPARAAATVGEGVGGPWHGATGALWQVAHGRRGWRLRAMNQTALDAFFPPDDQATAARAAAGALARELGAAIVQGDEARMAKSGGTLDPFGYGNRRVADVAGDWRRAAGKLGKLLAVEEIATSWIRRGPPSRTVTQLRVVYEHGALDETFLAWGDDESYMIPCSPAGFEFALTPTAADLFTAFDPVSGRSWSLRLRPVPPRALEIREIDPK